MDGDEIIETDDTIVWARQFEINDRIIGKTKISEEIKVSTVFLGVDHADTPEGPPVLFETMVFGGPNDQETQRYCTVKQARDGHAEMVRSEQAREAECQNL